MRNIVSFFALLILSCTNLHAFQVDYARDIKPMLIDKCSSCHGALAQEGGLRLDAAALIHRGGESGKVIDLDHTHESLLLRRVASDDADQRMPPRGEGEPLTEKQIKLLAAWIDAGAAIPKDETIPFLAKDHWAYQPIVRPTIPAVDASLWSTNPIDALIAAKHQQHAITSAPLADRHVLLRRLYLDLVGIPPTREQSQQYIDQRPGRAYAQLVDQLLESPLYGQRWGRHWMDVWRYSDWDGYKDELRGSQRHIWRWRDWIIESLNEDKGYDQMVLEMLAADEHAPDNFNAIRATGYLARNYHKSNRNIWLDATVEHTAKAFLAMTINCARCHDHKFDPVAQNEYYQLRAIFEPHQVRTEQVPGQTDLKVDGLPRAYDADLDVQTYLYLQGNEKHPDKEHPMKPAIPSLFDHQLEISPIDLPAVAVFPSLQPHIEREQTLAAQKQLSLKKAALEKLNSAKESATDEAGESLSQKHQAELQVSLAQARLASITARWAADKAKHADTEKNKLDQLAKQAAAAERALVHQQALVEKFNKQLAFEAAEKVEVAQLADANSADKAKKAKADNDKRKSNIDKAAKELKAAQGKLHKAEEALQQTDGKYTSVGKTYPAKSSGRRLALARWIIDQKNPLTARVAINHIWMRHFGEPLVANVFDLGLRCPRPTHADLLDWLAMELIENSWSMKHIHRLILNSHAYQIASSLDPKVASTNWEIDPDNHLIWKVNVRRLEAEVIRDSILSVAGSLDLKLGGPDIDCKQGETNARRSVYFRHAYEKQMRMLVLFDTAAPNECYRRSPSIIPQQSLALANGTLSLVQSRKLAQQLSKEFKPDGADSDKRFIQAAFQQVLTRQPTQSELVACSAFFETQTNKLADLSKLTSFDGKSQVSVPAAKDPKLRARENLIHVLMNHNDFVTVR